MTLLKAALLAWVLVCTAFAQTLPGLDEKPEDSSAVDTLLSCVEATNELMNIPAVFTSMRTLYEDLNIKIQSEETCESKGEDTICSFDVATVPTDYRTVCEANGGIYNEQDLQLTCQYPDNPFVSGTVNYRFINDPTCFSNTCQESDIEREIADVVDHFEYQLETNLPLICDSDYKIEETSAPKVRSGTCPNRKNATAATCGPLSTNVQSQQCDCYTFCDGVLVECEKFNSDGASEVFCPGELVMGCTVALFSGSVSSARASVAASWITGLSLFVALIL